MNATACPRANGQVERYNKTLVPILAKLVDKEKKDWGFLLEKVELVMNNMISSATGESPAKLLFGVNQNVGSKSDMEEWMEIINKEGEKSVEEIREEANENIVNNQVYNKKYYDRGVVKEKKFLKGDLVLIKGRKIVGQKSKLYGKFKGPYIVEKVLDKDRYLVTDLPGWQIGRNKYQAILDSARMKKFKISEEDLDIEERVVEEEETNV